MENKNSTQINEQKFVNTSSRNKLSSLTSKLPSDKKRLILLALIVLAIPLTVTLALYQQELRSRASGPTSPFNQAASLDGGYIELTNSGSNNAKLGFTVEARFKPKTPEFSGYIVAKNDTPNNLFELFGRSEKVGEDQYSVSFIFAVRSGVDENSCYPKFAPVSVVYSSSEILKWHHVAGVIQPNGEMNIYLNGQKSANVVSNIGNDVICSNNQPISIGAATRETAKGILNSYIDEIRISNLSRYTDSFVSPSVPFSSDDSTLALLHMDGNYDSSTNNDISGTAIGQVNFVSVEEPSTSITPTPTIPVAKVESRVFITSTSYNGNLGGLSGADSKCQARADAANLGGTWKAWLSDNSISAASRLNHSAGIYKLLTGDTIANDWNDLTDGNLNKSIDIDEYKNRREFYDTYIWTNTKIDGSIRGQSSCSNWTSASSPEGGYIGLTYYPTNNWTESSQSGCGIARALACFEQVEEPISSITPTQTAPTVTPTPAPLKIMGKHVDVNGNLLNLTGLNVTITNLSTNESQTRTGSSWSFEDLPRADYRVTAAPINGYAIEHMVCYECMDQDRFFSSNTFTITNTSSDYVGITFKYIAAPTFTLTPSISPIPSVTDVKKLTLNPSADAFVRSTAPNSNFGTNANLRVDSANPNEISYLKFNLTNLAGKTIKSAKLILKVSDPTNQTLSLRRATTVNWSETGITYNRRPSFEALITTFGPSTLNQVRELNVTNVVNLRKGGNMTLGITSGGDETGAFYSRESISSNRPRLIVEYY